MASSTWMRIAVLCTALLLALGLLVLLWNVSTPAARIIGPGISVDDQPGSAEPTPSPTPTPTRKKPTPSPTPSPSTTPPSPNNVITRCRPNAAMTTTGTTTIGTTTMTGTTMTIKPIAAWSIRTRLLTGMIALTAITLLVAGSVSYVFQRQQLNERLDGSLLRTVEELRMVAGTVDPRTLKPFTQAEDLLYTGMQQTMIGPTQGMIGIGGQEVYWKARTR